MIIKAAAVFFAMLALDFVWARYTHAITDRRAYAAAHYGAAIILLSGFGVTQYAGEPILLIPAALGAWLGTFIATRKH
jgi:hypothetical protein